MSSAPHDPALLGHHVARVLCSVPAAGLADCTARDQRDVERGQKVLCYLQRRACHRHLLQHLVAVHQFVESQSMGCWALIADI